jgi:hypothetical protein
MIDRFFVTASVAAQLGLQEAWSGLYARAVEACHRAGQPALAFAIAEGSKSRLLTGLLGRSDLPAPAILPAELVEQERALTGRPQRPGCRRPGPPRPDRHHRRRDAPPEAPGRAPGLAGATSGPLAENGDPRPPGLRLRGPAPRRPALLGGPEPPGRVPSAPKRPSSPSSPPASASSSSSCGRDGSAPRPWRRPSPSMSCAMFTWPTTRMRSSTAPATARQGGPSPTAGAAWAGPSSPPCSPTWRASPTWSSRRQVGSTSCPSMPWTWMGAGRRSWTAARSPTSPLWGCWSGCGGGSLPSQGRPSCWATPPPTSQPGEGGWNGSSSWARLRRWPGRWG